QQTYLTAAVIRVQTEANRMADTAALFMALGGNWPSNCTVPDWRACALGDPPESAPAVVGAAGTKECAGVCCGGENKIASGVMRRASRWAGTKRSRDPPKSRRLASSPREGRPRT